MPISQKIKFGLLIANQAIMRCDKQLPLTCLARETIKQVQVPKYVQYVDLLFKLNIIQINSFDKT